MPRLNRVDPFGDLQAVPERGMFTGNRGCLVDDDRHVVRHHLGDLWITCLTSYRGWKSPLDRPHRWTPLFFLDDAVALAAGHRPCGLCRRDDYLSYQAAVTKGLDRDRPVSAVELNRLLSRERLRRGRGLKRASDRMLWEADLASIPVGTVVVDARRAPHLVTESALAPFSFAGWGEPEPRSEGVVGVLTPPTSVLALRHGYLPRLHPGARAR